MAAEWHDITIAAFKANAVRQVTYVPDKVLTPLIAAVEHDPFFTVVAMTREEEAVVGIVSGAWMGGTLGEFNRDPAKIRDRFMRRLGTKGGGA